MSNKIPKIFKDVRDNDSKKLNLIFHPFYIQEKLGITAVSWLWITKTKHLSHKNRERLRKMINEAHEEALKIIESKLPDELDLLD